MGLDSVELVMAFEDEFELTIPNDVAAMLMSIGDVVSWVTAQRAWLGRPLPRDEVFDVVCRLTCEQCGTTRDRLTGNTCFVADLGID